MELSGKVAIVTGGASGLGRATAELFVEEGAKVVIADVDRARGEVLASELGAAAAFKETDVANADQVQQLVDFTVARFGGLHVMFNNAGIPSSRERFLDDDLNDFQRVMDVNLFGVMIGSQRAARHMAKNGGGSIINNSSIGGIQPGGGVISYRASKAAVIHVSRSMAVELGEYGIRVNAIAPGLIETPITSYDLATVRRRSQPLNREGLPSDVANAVVFLASDRSAQITGTVLAVDGGVTAGSPPTRFKEIMAARRSAAAQ